MAVLTLRSVKGAPLTNAELDGNFSNINLELTAVDSSISTLNSNVGILANLPTKANANVVASITEIFANIGRLSNLITTNKSNIVSAINEIRGVIQGDEWTGNIITVAKGGTGQTDKTSGFNALAPTTTVGDLIVHDGLNNIRLPGSTVSSKRFLTQTGTGAASQSPQWGSVVDGDIPSALTGKTYNALSLTAGAVGFNIAGGTTSKTLTISNSVTFSGTDGSTLNIGTGGTLGTAAFTSSSSYALVGGSNATGTWPISISGTAATATTASSVLWTNVSGRPTALSSFTNDTNYITSSGRAYPRRSDGGDLNFFWSGQSGQPTWLWGGNDGVNMYVYNPSNFNVNYAASSGTASSASFATNATNATNASAVPASGITGQTGMWTSSARPGPYRLYRRDVNDGYSVQTYWTGARWRLRGYYSDDNFHAEAEVGYADSAGSVLWTNVSGRPTALSSFSNDSQYITSGGRAYPRRSDGGDLNFFWSGQGGQPPWLWGGSDGANMYVYNPSNFSVNYATTAGALSAGNNYQVNSLGVGTGPTGTSGEIRATNNITAYYSDVRLKKVLGYIDNALEKITSLTGFYYQANETAQALGYKPVRDIGLSAQDVQKVLPEAIAPAPIDDKYLTVRYEKLIPMIVEAIKEMSERIKSLEAK